MATKYLGGQAAMILVKVAAEVRHRAEPLGGSRSLARSGDVEQETKSQQHLVEAEKSF